MRSLLAFFLTPLISAVAVPSTSSDPTPFPYNLPLNNFTYSGQACPQSTVWANVITINQTTGVYRLYHELGSFTPIGGPGRSNYRHICQLHAQIGVPKGFRAKVGQGGSDVRGFIDLPGNQFSTTFMVNWMFDSDKTKSSVSKFSFTGPFYDFFTKHAEAQDDGVAGSCDGDTLQTTFVAGIMAASGTQWPGELAVDPPEGSTVWKVVSYIELLPC